MESKMSKELTLVHVGVMAKLPSFQSCCSPWLTTLQTQLLRHNS